MIYVKRFLLVALIALLAVFAVQNQHFLTQPVELIFFKYKQTLMLGFWLVLSFVAGAALFLLIDLPRAFSLKRELSRKSHDLARTQFELNRAQAAATPPAPSSPPPADLGKRLEL
jgi:uncharacterized integral membrane protein